MTLFHLDDSIFERALADDAFRERRIQLFRRNRALFAALSFAFFSFWLICAFYRTNGSKTPLVLSVFYWSASMTYERDMRLLIAVRELKKQNGDHAAKL